MGQAARSAIVPFRRALGLAATLSFTSACSLLVDLDGLGGDDAGLASDAAVESGRGLDASTPSDASSADGAPVFADGGDAANEVFFDDFARNDGPPGNGWIEKNPGVFRIAGNHLVLAKASPSYLDDGLYRPMSELLLNVEVSVVFALSAMPPGFPQIPHACSGVRGHHFGHERWLWRLRAERHHGGASLPPERSLGERPQDAEPGAAPAHGRSVPSPLPRHGEQSGEPRRLGGTIGHRWRVTIIAHDTFSDSSTDKLDQPGTVSLSADTNANVSYDDFTRTPL